MKRVRCRWMQLRLPLLAGGDLLGQERRWAERHIRECPACHARLQSCASALSALRDSGSHTAVPSQGRSLWPGLRARLAETNREPTLSLARPWASRAGRWAIAATVLGLVFAGGFAFSTYGPWRFIPPKIVARRLPIPVIHPPSSTNSGPSSSALSAGPSETALARTPNTARPENRGASREPTN